MGRLSSYTLRILFRGARNFERIKTQPSTHTFAPFCHTDIQCTVIRFGNIFPTGLNSQNFSSQNSRAFYGRFYGLQHETNTICKMGKVSKTRHSGSKRSLHENEDESFEGRECSPPKKSNKGKKPYQGRLERKTESQSDDQEVICLDENVCEVIDEKSKRERQLKKKHNKHKHKKKSKKTVTTEIYCADGTEEGEVYVLGEKIRSERGINVVDIGECSVKNNTPKKEERKNDTGIIRQATVEDSPDNTDSTSPVNVLCSIVDLTTDSPSQGDQSPSSILVKEYKSTCKAKNLQPLDINTTESCDMDVESSPTVGGIHYVRDLEQNWKNEDDTAVSTANVQFAPDFSRLWQCQSDTVHHQNSEIPGDDTQECQNIVIPGAFTQVPPNIEIPGVFTQVHPNIQIPGAFTQVHPTGSYNIRAIGAFPGAALSGSHGYTFQSNSAWNKNCPNAYFSHRTHQHGFHSTSNHSQQDTGERQSKSSSPEVEIDMSKPYRGANAWMRQRRWDYTEFGSDTKRGVRHNKSMFEFTVASYNVLAQNLIEDNPNLYDRCRQRYLKWEYRSQNLLHEISQLSPDVLSMQEVNSDHYDSFFVPELKKLGYVGAFKKRTYDKFDGCAIFWKESKFHLDKCVPVEYFKPGVRVLDRDNVALLVLLQPKGKKITKRAAKLCVANTHLLFNPRRGDVKLAQSMVLMAEIEKLSFIKNDQNDGKEIYHPVILCGDFNCTPFCDLYTFFGRGFLEYDGLLQQRISGQKDGAYTNRKHYLGKQVIPKHVGITDKCQFVEEVKHRRTTRNVPETIIEIQDTVTHATEATEVKSKAAKEKTFGESSPQQCTPVESSSMECNEKHNGSKTVPQKLKEPSLAQCTGTLSHKAKFVSVYKHEFQKGKYYIRESSTCHSLVNCNVDYIFYSTDERLTKAKHGKFTAHSVKEGKLRLMARLELPSERQLDSVGNLPNEAVSSDHTVLMCRFALDINKD